MSIPRFFASMDAYFRAAASPSEAQDAALAELRCAHPGWDASPLRVAIYGRFVAAHVRDTLEKNFPLTRGVVGEATWSDLVRAFFATDPARHFEMNQLCAGFPAFLADHVDARALPPFVPALARFEWTDFEVYASADEIPERVAKLTPNPTVTVLQHSWLLVPWLRAESDARAASPEKGEETVLLWRHPLTHRTMYRSADPGSLLVLKLAVEGLSEADAAAAGGLSVEDVKDLVNRTTREGLVLASAQAESRRG